MFRVCFRRPHCSYIKASFWPLEVFSGFAFGALDLLLLDWFLWDLLQIAHAPPGTQAMTLDIAKFHRLTPIAPAHKAWFVMQNRPGDFYLPHSAVFGSSGAESTSEETRDFGVEVWRLEGISPVTHWSDDLNVFRYPISGNGISSPFVYAYDSARALNVIAPLGIPWHPFEKKGQDFAFTTSYTGFEWDIPRRLVSLPDKKRLKFLRRVSDFLQTASSSGVTVEECMKIQGTLIHILFVAPLGRSYIPALSRFIAMFNANADNAFSRWHLHKNVKSELAFWVDFLSRLLNPREIRPRGLPIDLGISVDASTDWGVGIAWDGLWAGWRAFHWSGPFRNIGWLEGVAVEFVVYALVEKGYRDCCVLVLSDNKGVIAAFRCGRSRNVEVNLSIRRAMALMWSYNLSFELVYVRSAENPADPISRGILGPRNRNLRLRFELPTELSKFFRYA